MLDVWKDLDSRRPPSWFHRDKFGIFIHWGPYSVPSYRSVENKQFGSYAEWYYASVYGKYRNHDQGFHRRVYGDRSYRSFAQDFKAELYDPDRLASLIRDSGARYTVLTAKHHDGYCLWPTRNRHKRGWNSGDVGAHRDLLGDLRQAIISQGMRFGIYYSMIDWESVPSHRCDGGYFIPEEDVRRFGLGREVYLKEVLYPQLRELIENYEPSLFYADGGEWDLSEIESGVISFLTWLYKESPVRDEIVVNDRFYKEMPGHHGDYYSTEYRDKQVEGHLWEESRGIGESYGFNRAERLENYLPLKKIISELVYVISRGGNFLLNIGPMADGTIPVIEEERLKGVGAWLSLCGEAIFGTESLEGTGICPATTNDAGDCFLFFEEENFGEDGRVRFKFPVANDWRWGDNASCEIVGVCRGTFIVEEDVAAIIVDNPIRLARFIEKYGTGVVKISSLVL